AQPCWVRARVFPHLVWAGQSADVRRQDAVSAASHRVFLVSGVGTETMAQVLLLALLSRVIRKHREGRMRAWIATLVLAAAGGAHAQEGFPLDGTWRGELEGSGKAHATVVMVLQWDGQKITGTINPGPDAIQISDAKLIPDGWHVTVAAQNKAGKPIAF